MFVGNLRWTSAPMGPCSQLNLKGQLQGGASSQGDLGEPSAGVGGGRAPLGILGYDGISEAMLAC